MNYQELTRELKDLAQLIKRQNGMAAIAEILAYFLFGLASFFVLDYLGHFPLFMRLFVLIIGLVCLFYFFKKKHLNKCTKTFSEEEVSLMLEDKFPEFRSRAISTLQFSNESQTGMMSAQLIEGMKEQTFSLAEERDFKLIIDKSGLIKRVKYLALASVLIVVMFALAPQSFSLYLQRFISQVEYPTKTKLKNIEMAPYAIMGESFQIKVHVAGVIPSQGQLSLLDADEDIQFDLKPSDEPGIFICEIPSVLKVFEFEGQIGDLKLAPTQVKLEKRPVASAIQIHVSPPQYTGIKAYVENSGNIQVPQGSKITFKITPSKSLDELKFISEETLSFTQDGGHWIYEVDALKNFTYSFQMIDQLQLQSVNIPQYSIKVKEDRKPRIELVEPQTVYELSPKSRMRLEAKINDDYALSQVKVQYHVSDNGSLDEDLIMWTDWKNVEDLANSNFILKELWDNNKIELEKGQTLNIRLMAIDNSPESHETYSEELNIPIISTKELKVKLAGDFLNTIEPVEDILLKLNDVKRKTDRLGEK